VRENKRKKENQKWQIVTRTEEIERKKNLSKTCIKVACAGSGKRILIFNYENHQQNRPIKMS
jgi:hypothetical protein